MRKNQPERDLEGDEEPESVAPSDSLVRLNKFMAELGVASRRKCDELISSGKVSVDGQPTVALGTKIDPTRQVVDVNGVILKPLDLRRRYYLLNKPRRVVCTNEPREQRMRAIDMISDRNKGRIFTVGRLDEDSSGLLLLTNDGDFSNQIAHPRHSVPKTYLVKVRGRIDEEALARITEGVRLSEGRTSGAALHVERRSTEASVLTVTIREGKNREIRRVFAAMGYKVLRLHRVRIGALSDRRLKDGEWRPLTPEEVADLLDVANNKQRAEEIFARAAQGSYLPKPSEAGAEEHHPRPSRAGDRRDSERGERVERGSRFGGKRRDWHEPKDFRIRSSTRKPRPSAAQAGAEGEAKPEAPAERRGARVRTRAGGSDRVRTRTGADDRVRSRPGAKRVRATSGGPAGGARRGGSAGRGTTRSREGLERATASRTGGRGARKSGPGSAGTRRTGSSATGGRAAGRGQGRSKTVRRGGGR